MRVDLAGDAEQVLHVVADLVRDHVGLREVARRAQARAAACRRSRGRCRPSGRPGSRTAPSPPGRCRRRWAWRRGTAPACGSPVGRAALLEHARVQTSSVSASTVETNARLAVVGRRRAAPGPAAPAAPAPPPLEHAEQRERVDAEDPAGDQRDHDRCRCRCCAPPIGKPPPPPPPPPRRSSTLSLWRLPSHFMTRLLARHRRGRRRRRWHDAGTGVPRRPAAARVRSWAASRRAGPGTCRRGPCSWSRRPRRSRRTAPARSPRRRRSWPAAAWCC